MRKITTLLDARRNELVEISTFHSQNSDHAHPLGRSFPVTNDIKIKKFVTSPVTIFQYSRRSTGAGQPLPSSDSHSNMIR